MIDANVSLELEKDSLGIGEATSAVSSPVNKIIDAISSAIGTIYKPWNNRRLADAEAYKIKVLAKAQKEAESLGDTDLATRLDEVGRMVVAKELRRQENIAYIVKEAIKQIEQKKQISDEKVDSDWTTRFINIAQDISNEEMKNLWAQILAGEVAQPKTFSLRTLECLKNITKEEAELFVRLSSFVLKFDFFPYIYKNNEILNSKGISYMDIQKLIEIGLLNTSEKTCIVRPKEDDTPITITNQKKIGICQNEANKKKTEIPIYTFTSAGLELLSLTELKSDDSFLKEVLYDVKKYCDSVEYADFIGVSGNMFTYDNPVKL